MGKPRCFIIMPITTPKELAEKYRDPDHFIHVMECLFFPAIKEAGYEPCSPVAKGSDLIHEGIIKHLEEDEMVLCDMTTLNANVFFEFGIRTALNKPICLIRDETLGRLPFDTALINTHSYSSDLRDWIVRKEIPEIAQHIKDTAKSGDTNALWKTFGLQTQAKRTDSESTPMEAKMDLILRKFQDFELPEMVVPENLEEHFASTDFINAQLASDFSETPYNFHASEGPGKTLTVSANADFIPSKMHQAVSAICDSNFDGQITYFYGVH